MKRLITLLAVAAAVGVYAAPSGAVAPDTTGPPCADITFGNAGYAYYGADGQTLLAQPSLDFDIDLAAPSCAAVTYTLYIYDSTGNPIATLVVNDVSGESSIAFNYTFATTADADAAGLCLVVTTSLGKHVADRGPNASGCVLVLPNDPSASGFG